MFTRAVKSVECADGDLARALDAVRRGEATLTDLKDLIAASRAVEAKATALQTEAARLIAMRERHGDGGASVLRDQAGKSRAQARRRLHTAEVLDKMPEARAATEAGEVSLANAERLADAAKAVAPETVNDASDLLTMARELPPDRFAREASAWTQRHEADHGHSRYLRQRRRRYLKTWQDKDGTVCMDGRFDPEAGARICSNIRGIAEELRRQDRAAARNGSSPDSRGEPAASKSLTSESLAAGSGDLTASESLAGCDDSAVGEEPRTWDQLMADALDVLASGAAGSKDRGGTGGRPKAEVIVVADIGVLTGDDPAGRCEIPGVGPVPPEVLQRIACDARLTGLLFDKGEPLYHGAAVRTATTAQWRMLIARDGGCIGCGAPHNWCQAHHTVPFAQSRRTGIDQLVLVCWRCHHNIHDHNWRVVRRNGKFALEPPNLTGPSPGSGDRRRPDGGQRTGADRNSNAPPTRDRANPDSRHADSGAANLGNPARQRTPALFTA